MSSLAKQAREAMKEKASRLTTADPHQKVDSSSWTPPEALNTEVKTGLRPVSRRAFKSGGKVSGAKAKLNLGAKPRTGNKAITADSLINRNVKEANEERPGGTAHIGGYKKGGRLKRNTGGDAIKDYLDKNPEEKMPLPPPRPKNLDKPEPSPKYRDPNDLTTQGAKKGGKIAKCYGGKTKKADGGSLENAKAMMAQAKKTANVPSGGLYGAGFSPTTAGSMSPAGAFGKRTMKKGGMAHDDAKADMALIKKMVKPAAMRKGRATGGEVFAGESYPGKIPGVVPGGREAHAKGGKTKGKGKDKTHINIMIAAGKPGMGDMMPPGGPTPPPGMDGGPGGIAPVPMAPPPGGAPGGAPMPMPIPMPMPMAGGAPGGPAPMPRKSGGRLTPKASSYKDMKAGAGSGEGRLQKTDIAKARMGRKAGGKTYRSYKDMDAGAGSGLGRLEKTEIQAHKR